MLFRSEHLGQSFHDNLFFLLAWCIRDFGAVVSRSRSVSLKQLRAYVLFLKKYIPQLKGLIYWCRIWMLLMSTSMAVGFHVSRKSVRA
jgi:hypothetical protein